MHAHTDDGARVRAWKLRSAFALGFACFMLASMATLALASTGSGPSSAISETALDRLLDGQRPTGKHVATKLTAQEAAIPRTPAGAQLAWLLAEFNGGSATLTPSEVRAHIARAFLVALPADRTVQLLRLSTTAYGPLRFTGISGRPSARSISAEVTTHAHRTLVIRVTVAASVPYKITDLDISDGARGAGA